MKIDGIIPFLQKNGSAGIEQAVKAMFMSDESFLEVIKSKDLADFFMSNRCLEEKEPGCFETGMMWLLPFRHRKDLGVTPERFARLIVSFCRNTVEYHPELEAAGIMRANFIKRYEPWEENSEFEFDKDEDIIDALYDALVDDGDKEGVENALLLLSGLLEDDFLEFMEKDFSHRDIIRDLRDKANLLGPSRWARKSVRYLPIGRE